MDGKAFAVHEELLTLYQIPKDLTMMAGYG